VVLCNDNRELSSFTVFQSESLLLSATVRFRRHRSEAGVSLKTVSLEGAEQPVDSIRIHFVGAFML
jgi:hypothetical protein